MSGANHSVGPSSDTSVHSSVLGLVLRLFWMFLGTLGLAASGLYIINYGAGLFSMPDVIYWTLVPLMLLARYVDIVRFRGATAYGEPATLVHWRHYALGLVVGSIAVWILMHGIAHAWLK